MPHLIEKHEGDQARKMAADRLCGPNLPAEIVQQVEQIEWWGSDFNEPGTDYNLFICRNKEGVEITRKRVEGY